MSTYRRQQIWAHNSFSGHARMMQVNCRSIINAVTPTNETKEIAAKIELLAGELLASLKQRKDQIK